jgi:hypothetical protein
VSEPNLFFAGNATQGSPGLTPHTAAASSTAVNGFRYNARLLARHLAETRFGLPPLRSRIERDAVIPYLLGELARGPEIWIQKGYLARVLTFDGAGAVDHGVEPLAHFVDSSGPPAVAVAIEVAGDGTIAPAVYARRTFRVTQDFLEPDPLRRFNGPAYERELLSLLRPFLV